MVIAAPPASRRFDAASYISWFCAARGLITKSTIDGSLTAPFRSQHHDERLHGISDIMMLSGMMTASDATTVRAANALMALPYQSYRLQAASA